MNLKSLSSLFLMGILAMSSQAMAKGDKKPSIETNEVKDEVSYLDSATKRTRDKLMPAKLSDSEIEKKLQTFSADTTNERIKKIEELKTLQQNNLEKVYANQMTVNQELTKMYQEAKPTDATQRRELFEKMMKKEAQMREYERGLNDEFRKKRADLFGEDFGRKGRLLNESNSGKRKY